MHLQMDEHMIFALEVTQRKHTREQTVQSIWSESDKVKPKPLMQTTMQGGKTHLIALAVVLQAAWSFAVAAFAVSAVWLALFAFTNLRFKGLWVPIETRL